MTDPVDRDGSTARPCDGPDARPSGSPDARPRGGTTARSGGHSRRSLLRAAGAGAAVAAGAATAGCLGGGTGDPDCSTTLPTPVRGDPEAAVTVAAFEDYACGHCRTYVLDVLPQILEEYAADGQIRYEHHDFPLPLSSASWRAPSAARAVQATAGSEAFWTYSTRLYEEQDRLGGDLYAELAAEVGADPDTVRSAAAERRYDPTVRCDKRAGEDRGVGATPTVFVQGDRLQSYAYEPVASAIETALSLEGVEGR